MRFVFSLQKAFRSWIFKFLAFNKCQKFLKFDWTIAYLIFFAKPLDSGDTFLDLIPEFIVGPLKIQELFRSIFYMKISNRNNESVEKSF